MADFAKYIDTDYLSSGELLIIYGVPIVDPHRCTKPKIRDYVADSTRLADTTFRLIRFVLELLGAFQVLGWNRNNADQVEEIVIPERAPKYSIEMSAIGGRRRPDRNATNQIGLRFSGAQAKYPPYAPYIAPNLATAHRSPDNPEYRRSPSGRVGKMKGGEFPYPFPLRDWAVKGAMFTFTADLSGAFLPLAGVGGAV